MQNPNDSTACSVGLDEARLSAILRRIDVLRKSGRDPKLVLELRAEQETLHERLATTYLRRAQEFRDRDSKLERACVEAYGRHEHNARTLLELREHREGMVWV